MWLHVDNNTVFVDTDAYIESQPVSFDQVRDVIDSITQPVNVYIDVSRVDITLVDFVGLVNIVWDIHLYTEHKRLLDKIYFMKANSLVESIWTLIKRALPKFVQECVYIKKKY
jgi:hypothetical protein